ncbi:MFS general substrate transporter [Dendrothele bispora CBS 962.96]|uniref:MFS general substrate transporter n=1 Tax=Dendrothele bispora (strain CBS 962.96) TaxID=1314807 RepID=A0A4S8L150_DENBC|nr:MFS general substrate transporter [Dendrothele bispora CBS 962.96]
MNDVQRPATHEEFELQASQLGAITPRTRTTTALNSDAGDGLQATRSDADVLQNSGRESGRPSSSSSSPVPLPPEAVTRSYQIKLVLAGSLMIFHIIGINQVYGIFQEFYTSSRSNISDAQGQDALVSLVGSIGTGLTWSGCIFVSPLLDKTKNLNWSWSWDWRRRERERTVSGSTRTQSSRNITIDNVKLITLVGALIMSMGLVFASFATKLWHLYLTQALLYGLGSSMYYYPLMTLAPTYFDRHRGFAMGLILAGSGVGGLVMALVLQNLLDRYGIGWALRILGVWNFVVGVGVAMVVRGQRQSGGENANGGGNGGGSSMPNKSLMRRGTFWYQSFAAFLQAGGNVVPLYYMSSYAVSVLLLPQSTSSLFVSINSGVNSVSRILMGILADHIGRQNTLVAGTFLSSLSVFALWYSPTSSSGGGGASDINRFIAFVVMYGIYAGGYNALLPTTIMEVYGVENYKSVNSVMYFIRGLGSIFGAPVAGVILGSHKRGGGGDRGMGRGVEFLRKKYNDVVVYDGVLLMAAAVCVVYVRWLDARDKGRWRWKA